MRRVLALSSVIVVVGVATYACSNDQFVGGDDASSDASSVDALAVFCNAELQYATTCGSVDAACVQNDLAHCASTYATLSPAYAQALATCVASGTESCSNLYEDGGCVLDALKNNVNDGGVFNQLAKDYCKHCTPLDINCVQNFGPGVGLLASIFNDGTIGAIDDNCTGGPVIANDDGGIGCTKAFLACEVGYAQATLPTACDGGN